MARCPLRANFYRIITCPSSTKIYLIVAKQSGSAPSGEARTHYSEKPFIFRGLMRCAISGKVVACDIKKGKHIYLICRDPANPAKKLFVPEVKVLEQVKAVFRSFHIEDDVLEALTKHLQEGHEAEKQVRRGRNRRATEAVRPD